MKRLLPALLIILLSIPSAMANDPKKPYVDQQKYQKMFCVLAGIPINMCRGKKR